ncbi:MAG: PQQ-binding-like beta-propeller repeat protein, partial [Planctomycetaceae bacterium]|nr:PQQ-binding-like beta-propeller repeat protein [Planctomycetaceae bacterium]
IPSNRSLAPYGLELQWWGQAIMDPAQDVVVYVAVDEDNVYVQSRDGIVTAFQGDSGKRLWSQMLGSTYKVGMPLATNERYVFVAVGLDLFALNKFTGELEWELPLTHHPSTAPEADNDHIYIGMVDGSLFCYDLNKIRQFWEEGKLPRFAANAFLWKHKAALELTSPPVSNGEFVSFASLSGTVYSVSTRDHKLKFQFETDEPIQTPIGRGAGSLFVVSEDSRLYCLNRDTGLRRWTFTSGVPIREQPLVIGSSVYVTPLNDGMYCLNVATGTIKWRQQRAAVFLGATDRYVFATDKLNNVLLLSHDDGGILGELATQGFTCDLPNERTDRLFLVSPDGLVVCIRETGQEFPIYYKFPERRPILPELAIDPPAAEAPAQ